MLCADHGQPILQDQTKFGKTATIATQRGLRDMIAPQIHRDCSVLVRAAVAFTNVAVFAGRIAAGV